MSDDSDSGDKGGTWPDKGRVVQAWMSYELLAELDEKAAALRWTRSKFIVEAVERLLVEARQDERPAAPVPPPSPTP